MERRRRDMELTFAVTALAMVLYPPQTLSKMGWISHWEGNTLQLDDRMKQLLRELGHAINDSVSESERIAEAISGVRAAGFEIVLKLDATIGLARKGSQDAKMTRQDRRFLESLHIRVDEDVLEEEPEERKLAMTAQDIKFLKSLKISFDEEL